VNAVSIVGGGLAGLACAAALGEAGYEVDVYEARPFLGGRAASYEDASGEVIDNCQHVLLGCCHNLLDFYRRLGTGSRIHFHERYHFLEPGGRLSTLVSRPLAGGLHFAASFAGLEFLSWREKAAIGRGLLAIRRRNGIRPGPGATMAEWLASQDQPEGAVERFWRPVLVSAVNEELGRMAAAHAFQVFRLGFLSGARESRMGVPAVPLGELYSAAAWKGMPNVRIHLRAAVEAAGPEGITVHGEQRRAGAVVIAAPFERVSALAPGLGLSFEGWEHSPITGVHLWFDRAVTSLPHAALLDRTIQWFFNKQAGRYLQLVVSASRSLMAMPRGEVIEMARRELAEFLPEAGAADLVRAHVVKEVRATFSARPGLSRPGPRTVLPGVFLAGDWTDTGWPATMEGAVRSGYSAAEAVAARFGSPRRFLIRASG
jgi:zeta-carotene desaturase